ncbi:MAG: DUF4252 domain-containing protein [Acidobacteriota bacterium]
MSVSMGSKIKSQARRPLTAWASLLLVATLTTGCRETPSAAGIRWQIERQLPGIELERETSIRLGRFTLAVAKRIARWATDEDDVDLSMLSHVRRVNVTTYLVHAMPDLTRLDLDDHFESRLADEGWESLIRSRENDERTWVFYREGRNESIRNLFVVTLDPSDLVVVGIEGRLDRLIAEALADDPDAFIDLVGA